MMLPSTVYITTQHGGQCCEETVRMKIIIKAKKELEFNRVYNPFLI